MEGVTDSPMRAVLTRFAPYSHCVTEFVRVSQNPIPASVFSKRIPELAKNAKTPTGTPVQVQLLGGDPGRLAESALAAVSAGAKAIDLNFGCPAPTVNSHDGGATLLKYPDRIKNIVQRLRSILPPQIPVSAKLRLGWDSHDQIDANAEAAAEGGASWITIHGRTKIEGYRPPADWIPIGRVARKISIPVIANGDLWTIHDIKRCHEETGTLHFMLGRSALANPFLALEILREWGAIPEFFCQPSTARTDSRQIEVWLNVFETFIQECNLIAPNQTQYPLRRLKQWIGFLSTHRKLESLNRLKRIDRLETFLSEFALIKSLD